MTNEDKRKSDLFLLRLYGSFFLTFLAIGGFVTAIDTDSVVLAICVTPVIAYGITWYILVVFEWVKDMLSGDYDGKTQAKD